MKDVIEKIKYLNNHTFPRKEIEEIKKNKDKYIPDLLKELKKVVDNPSKYEDDEDFFLHIYCLYLLAEFREPKAFPLIIKLIKYDEDTIEFLLGGVITEDLDSILASTYNGDNDLLISYIMNDKYYKYARTSALQALMILNCNNVISDNEMNKIIDDVLKKEYDDDDDDLFYHAILDYYCFKKMYEKKSLIGKLFDEEKISLFVQGDYADFIDRLYGSDDDQFKTEYITDTIKSLSSWACFSDQDSNSKFSDEFEKDIYEKYKDYILNGMQKNVGRNDPCPCGSGKKYKKCCMLNENNSPAEMYIKKSLNEYPSSELSKYYKEDVIKIDYLLYTIFKIKMVPIAIKRNYEKENDKNIKSMNEAMDLIELKCKKEKINTVEKFDNIFEIHYSLYNIIKNYLSALKSNDDQTDYELIIIVMETIKRFTKFINLNKNDINKIIGFVHTELFDRECDEEETTEIYNLLKEIFPEHKKLIFTCFVINQIYISYDIEFDSVEEYVKELGTSKDTLTYRIKIYLTYMESYVEYDDFETAYIILNKLINLLSELVKFNDLKSERDYNELFGQKYKLEEVISLIDAYCYNSVSDCTKIEETRVIKKKKELFDNISNLLLLNDKTKKLIKNLNESGREQYE